MEKHFPDTAAEYKDVSSIKLLYAVKDLIFEKGYDIINIDATVVAQRPQLAPFIPQMRENIAEALNLDLDQVSVKATTEEGLGFTGTEAGISGSGGLPAAKH